MVFIHDDDLVTLRNGEPELIRPTDTVKKEKLGSSSFVETILGVMSSSFKNRLHVKCILIDRAIN